MASSGTAPKALASCASWASRTPAGVSDKGEPAEESAISPHRPNRACTLRANSGSGVTSATVCPGFSTPSRISTAASAAAASSVRAVTAVRPSSPSAMGSPPPSRISVMAFVQSAVDFGGFSASAISRRRARPRRAFSPASRAGQARTSVRSMPCRPISRFSAPCGCCSPSSSAIWSHAVCDRSRSSPGSTTQPEGARATAPSTVAAAGTVPVDPAAITGKVGGRSSHASASRFSSVTRRAAGSLRPSSSSRRGHASTATARKAAVERQCSARSAWTRSATRAGSATSSIWQESRNATSASAISSARRGSTAPPW